MLSGMLKFLLLKFLPRRLLPLLLLYEVAGSSVTRMRRPDDDPIRGPRSVVTIDGHADRPFPAREDAIR